MRLSTLTIPLLLVAACSGSDPKPAGDSIANPGQDARPAVPAGLVPGKPNLLVITLDTTRADHLGCYGYFRDTSPNLDALAAESLLFERCIVPMAAFFEDDYRNGKALPTRISRIDGKPMGVAGVWAQWTGPDGEVLLSYALLTVNANSHALLHRYQQPGAEKRMPAILNEGAYDAWLNARVEKAREFMRQYPSNWLTANPVERKADKRPPGLMG